MLPKLFANNHSSECMEAHIQLGEVGFPSVYPFTNGTIKEIAKSHHAQKLPSTSGACTWCENSGLCP